MPPRNPRSATTAIIPQGKDNSRARRSFSSAARLMGTPRHQLYRELIQENRIVFALGPAGTGKTYIAVEQGCHYLENTSTGRILLTRPAVTVGESLGFLPGDMKEKIDPYMRPLYDALSENLGAKKVIDFINEGAIEIAGTGFMRGRTITDAFMIIDEGQNCTYAQLKMLLTRLGNRTRIVVTGDLSQSDLPAGQSGLEEIVARLKHVPEIACVEFTENDVMRDPLVSKMLPCLDGPSPLALGQAQPVPVDTPSVPKAGTHYNDKSPKLNGNGLGHTA